MPRLARVAAPGVPHHVTQRGNNRQDVFFTDDDRQAYLALLGQHAERYGLSVWGPWGWSCNQRRIEDSAGLRNLLWDLENLLVETDSGNGTVARYTLAPQLYGELVSQRRAGATSFHHFDALGSTSYLTDASQNPLVAYLYRAFGQQTILSGSSANPFTWVGRIGYYRQPDCQDYWVRARVLDPEAGRWFSREAVAMRILAAFAGNWVSAHPYSYAGNNPTNMIDPSGLWCAHFPRHRCMGTTCHGDPYCLPMKPPKRPPPTPQCCPRNPQVPDRALVGWDS